MKVDGLLLLLHRLELSLILAPVILDKAAVQLGASAWAAPICAYLVSTRLAIFLVSWVYGVLVPLLIVYITGFTHFRWQSIPAMLSLSVTASNVYADPELYGNVLRGFSLYAFAIPRAGIFLLSQLLSWLVQVPQLATPDGPYGVGVDSETFEDGGLQVSVNIFYPVSKLAPTDLTFQYVNESSVRVIGKSMLPPKGVVLAYQRSLRPSCALEVGFHLRPVNYPSLLARLVNKPRQLLHTRGCPVLVTGRPLAVSG